jgi:hypothetical protein
MPELIPQSTAAPAPPPPPDFPPFRQALIPPKLSPANWEKLPCFRETFLMYITPPGYLAAFWYLGEMLYNLVLETPAGWPEWRESATRTEMRAAMADLRHLQGFLASVGREHKVSSLDAEDAYLSKAASTISRQLGKLAGWLEEELASIPAPPEVQG